jgi:hypothetical protein
VSRDKCLTVLTGYDARTGYALGLPVEKKGAIQYALESLRNFTDTLGYDDFLTREDGEYSLQALLKGFAYMSHDRKIEVQKISVGGHQSIGSVERSHQTLAALTRVLLEVARVTCGFQIEPLTRIFIWAERHAGWLLNNCRIRSDGSTSEEIANGEAAKHVLGVFGEVVHVKLARPLGAAKSTAWWYKVIYLGRLAHRHLVGTTAGVARVREIVRLPEPECRNRAMILSMAGAAGLHSRSRCFPRRWRSWHP